MANELEVVDGSLESAAVRVYVPVAAMTRLLKLATPLTAATVAVVPPPKNVPPLSVTVTLDVLPVATLPNPSSSETATEGLTASPAYVLSAAE